MYQSDPIDIKTPRDWFSVTIRDVHTLYGKTCGVLNKYAGSLSRALTTIYPEYTQACRYAVLHIVQDLKLNKVEDLLSIPLENPDRLVHTLTLQIYQGQRTTFDEATQ